MLGSVTPLDQTDPIPGCAFRDSAMAPIAAIYLKIRKEKRGGRNRPAYGGNLVAVVGAGSRSGDA